MGLGTPFAGNLTVYPIYRMAPLTGVDGGVPQTTPPDVYTLNGCYPNPTNNVVVLSYQLPKTTDVSIGIYNIAGQIVKRFETKAQPAGTHQIKWQHTELSNGIYFYQLKAGSYSATRKMVVLR